MSERQQVTYEVQDTTAIGKYARSLAGTFTHCHFQESREIELGPFQTTPFISSNGKKMRAILEMLYGENANLQALHSADALRQNLRFPAVGLAIGTFPGKDPYFGYCSGYIALAETVPGGLFFTQVDGKDDRLFWGYKTQDYFEKSIPLPLCAARIISGTGSIILDKEGAMVASSGDKMDGLLKETERHVDRLAMENNMKVGSLVCGVKVDVFGKQFEDCDGHLFGGEGSDAVVTVSVTQLGMGNKDADKRAANEVFKTAYKLREEVKNVVEDEIYARFIA